ncbi:HAD hydrolase-like protein [Streptomyces sp. TG1A-8]|uniref:HAD hydrolase-like protein n=1 Tax=Streptomyces sp. TG1A-8 TaxID=3051385 RepID=UPI00265BF1C5|nr:HAD hydrolase-like protein [Streptomyces sp. TG1A-8]MDO0929016.1 HAD hydrolase-like protein [Streptomyces sp. TG1A-8]
MTTPHRPLLPVGGGWRRRKNRTHTMGYSARIFDFDGTLVDTGTLNLTSCHAALCCYTSITVPCASLQLAPLGDLAAFRRWLIREHKVVLPCTDAEWVAAVRVRWLASAVDHLRELPAARLARAAAARGPVAVASSNDGQVVRAGLRFIGLAETISTVVAREDVAALKPAPDAYLAAAAQLDVPAQECLAYENTDEGVLAAQTASMDVIDVRCIRRNP